MRRALLVRHGQSTWNVERRYQGRADPSLTERGRAGATALAERLQDVLMTGSVALGSSPLRRAHETATIIGVRSEVTVMVDVRLVERDVGPWQGLTVAEIDAGWPGAREARRWPSGAETTEQIIGRVVPALRDLTSGGREAVIITHAGVIRSLMTLTGVDHGVPNLGGTWFDLDGHGDLVGSERFGAEDDPDDDVQSL